MAVQLETNITASPLKICCCYYCGKQMLGQLNATLEEENKALVEQVNKLVEQVNMNIDINNKY